MPKQLKSIRDKRASGVCVAKYLKTNPQKRPEPNTAIKTENKQNTILKQQINRQKETNAATTTTTTAAELDQRR